MDEVALQEVSQKHPGGVARKVQAGRRCKVRRKVYGLFNVEWRGGQKSSESGRQRTRSLEQGLMPWKKEEGVQGGPSISSREGEESVEVEDEAESRRKLDEQKKLQKDLREVERLWCVSKDMQESIRESLQQKL